MSRRGRSAAHLAPSGTEAAFSEALRAREDSDSNMGPGVVSSVVREYCNAEPGPWEYELAVAAKLEAWAVRCRTVTNDLDPEQPVDITDVSLTIVDVLNSGARGQAFTEKALVSVRKVLGVYSEFPLSPESPEPLGALPAGGGGDGGGDGDDGDGGDGDGDDGGGGDGDGDDGDDGGDDGDGGGDGGDGGAKATAGAKVAAPGDAGAGAKFAFVPPQHGGVGSWSHVLLDATSATVRSTAQTDSGKFFLPVRACAVLIVIFRKRSGRDWFPDRC